MQGMIHVDRLTKYFGPILAVDNISFQVNKGEIVGFLGPNGAGKSTTIRILTSYLPATNGIARVAGFDVMNESLDVRRNMGYLPESVPLYRNACRKVSHVPRRLRAAWALGRQRHQICMERCRIFEVRRRLIGTLSKATGNASASPMPLCDPQILILDGRPSDSTPCRSGNAIAYQELGQQHAILFPRTFSRKWKRLAGA